MHDVMRFWLDRGVDGFRIDVVHCIGRDPALPDDEPPWETIPHCASNEHPSTHEHIRASAGWPTDTRATGSCSARPPSRPRGGWLRTTATTTSCTWPSTSPSPTRPGTPTRGASGSSEVEALLDPRGAWPTWVLSNHDVPRHRTRYGGSEARARAAAVAILTQRGTPVLYAGEELGLEDAVIPPDRVVDPGGRDGCRAPVPWDREAPHGWGEPTWLPFPPDAGDRSVAAQVEDPSSILHLYRRLLHARRSSPALQLGDIDHLDGAPEGVLAWHRTGVGADQADRRTVLVNQLDAEVEVPSSLWEGTVVEVASDGIGEGAPFDGVLRADAGLVLRPRG